MRVEELTEVCRLCLKTENLLWIFDRQFENIDSLKDVILTTTGVEVIPTDFVSQKICRRCMQIVIKMEMFRQTSIGNDVLLKEKYKEFIKNDDVAGTPIKINSENNRPQTNPTISMLHPTVQEVFVKYPNIKLPKTCLKMDIAPCVSMTMNEVENYFKQRNRDMVVHSMDALSSSNSTDNEQMVVKKNSNTKEQIQNNSILGELSPKSIYNNEKPIISPISIKLTNPEKTEYTIVRHSIDLKTVKSELKRKLSSRDDSSNGSSPSTHKKRRTSISSTDSDKKENTKPNLMESLGLTPTKVKSNSVKETPEVQVSRTERSLAICNICNSVHYNLKELKRHQLKHLRCQFCKSRFKTMALKDEHIKDTCIIKTAMNSAPSIEIEKIEYDLKIRKKYPDAFSGFPPIPGLITDSSDPPNSEKKVESTYKCTDDNDVIEIISDDEEPTAGTSKDSEETYDQSKLLTRSSENSQNARVAETEIPNPSTARMEQQQIVNVNDQPNISSTSVTPDIKIKNNLIFDTIDPKATDLMVLTELLKNYKKLKLNKYTGTVPAWPSITLIEPNVDASAAMLKNLRLYLYTYRIPVEIKNGQYKVSFNYFRKEEKIRKMADWGHLIPIDLKAPKQKITVVRSNSDPNQPAIVSNPNDINNGNNQAPQKLIASINATGTSSLLYAAINSPPISTIAYSRSNSVPPNQKAIYLNSSFRNQVDNSYNLNQPSTATNNNSALPRNCSQYQNKLNSNVPQQLFVVPSTRYSSKTSSTLSNSSINTLSNHTKNGVIVSTLGSQPTVSFKSPESSTNAGHILPNITPVVSYNLKTNLPSSSNPINIVVSKNQTNNCVIASTRLTSATGVSAKSFDSSMNAGLILPNTTPVVSYCSKTNLPSSTNMSNTLQIQTNNRVLASTPLTSATAVSSKFSESSMNAGPILPNITPVVSYSSKSNLLSSSRTNNTLPNQTNNCVIMPTPLTSQTSVPLRFPDNSINAGHTLPNTSSLVNYSNTVIVTQNSTVSAPVQLTYQQNLGSTALVNPQNINYLQCNSNTMYNNGTSAIISNNVPQFLNSTDLASALSNMLQATLTTSSIPSYNAPTVHSSIAGPSITSVRFVPSNVNHPSKDSTSVGLNNNASNQTSNNISFIRVKNLTDLK